MRKVSRKLNMRDKPRKRSTAWKRVVSAMAVIVVFCTVYALVLPAITLSEDPICGQQAHEHTDACYRTEIIVDNCAAAAHVHGANCAGPLGKPSCGFGEQILHTHGDSCYDRLGKLICRLPELQEHIHGETCQKTELKLTCTEEEVQGHTHSEACTAEAGLVCALEETQGHAHADSCYENKTVLTCQEPEQQPHTHADGCYQLSEEPVCCEAAEDHVHEDACYESVPVCTQKETLGHVHIDSCYELQQNLICTRSEAESHTHTDTCWSEAKTCSLEELEGHTHGEQCYEKNTTETCDLEQAANHIHTESCFDEAGERTCGLISGVVHVHDETCVTVIRLDEPELICKLPEHIHVDACYLDPEDLPPVQKEFYCDLGEHEHIEECYDAAGQLICTIPVHDHDVSCKVPSYDPEADVETAEDWEATLKEISLTGKWPEDLLAVAATQLDYTESKQNVILHEDGSVKGYTRYGAWYGAPYIDWSAAFVSFCVNYAGIDAMPQDSSCESYLSKLEDAGLLRSPGSYLPKPGDVVLLDTKTDEVETKPNQMGIVAELLLSEAGELTTVKVLAGDASDKVQYLTYDLLSSMIVGYGETPAGEAKTLLCDQDHEHTDECYGYKVYYNDDTMHAQVLIQGISELLDGVTLQVNRITAASDPAGYSSMIAALSQQMQQSPYYMGDASFYQMQLLLDGESYPLPDSAKTSVDVSFTDPVFTPEAMEGATKVETYLLTQAEQEETPQTSLMSGTISSTMSQALSGTQEQAAAADATETVPDTYQVEQVEEDTYENASGGLTGVGFESDMLSTFAVVLSNTTKTGTFWERIFDTSEIVSGGTYMIVSAEGNFALRGDNSNNYTAVTIQAQKGEEDPDADWEDNPERNTRYYTITTSTGDAVDNNLYWTFTGSGSSYTIRNQGTSNYLYMESVRSGWWSSTDYLIYSGSQTLTLNYVTPENCWRIANGSDYLRNAGTGAFNYSSDSDGSYNSNAVYYYTRDMLIFKLSDVTSLSIPDDVVDSADSGSGSTAAAPDKPDYGEFIDPTGGLQGETAVTEGSISIKGEYYSDPSTSDIETQFRKDTYAENEVSDGRVVTDKSVVYGADDYGAFESYDANTFGVTLSALGQEYEIPYQYMVKTPVDVVYVLDVSGSMSSNSTEQGENPDRVVDLKEAVNASMAQILADHEANRVGIAIYSGGAWEMLPLGRYTADNNEYLVTSQKTFSHSPTNVSFTINYLLGSSSLKSEDGTSYANVGEDAVQGIGTYTQAGIAMGNEIFEAIGDDTTYTTTIGEGENQRPYTVKRQPVFILVSDGEPTYSTNIYNDVLKGPHYGNGGASSSNGKGIHGYYTVLSANYYKRAVGIQYDKTALFYSIGMGIHETEDGPLVSTSQTGDNYKRAVLNPEQSIIENLTANTAKEITVDQLKGMLLNTYTDRTVQVSYAWPEEWYGIPHAYEPVLQPNPYTDNFSYADGAYFGDLPESELKEIFEEIYQSSVSVSPYGFILYQNSSVDIVDKIGSGMEIKGTPVLRYGGVNYTDPIVTVDGNVTTYTYSGTYTDPYIPDRTINLDDIRVSVITDENGDQTVELYVPDTALPTYTPELVGQQFYYEQLPVRLIYQVGLTEEARAEVLSLSETGGELVYYTNKWSNDDELATTILLPSAVNPYYYNESGDVSQAPYHAHHEMKSENTTNTVDYYLDCSRSIETVDGEVLIQVIHKQGNNGKLVFTADTVNIPVEKQWGDGINADIMNPVEAVVYKVTETVDENGATIRNAEQVSSVSLSTTNNWAATIENLQAPDGTWYYAIAEAPVAGYTPSYDQETIKITTDAGDTFFDAVKIESSGTKITMTNTVAVKLPSTGGGGTQLYTLGGLLLMTAAAILWYSFYLKRRREESPSP